MKAIVVTDQAAGTAGVKLVERPAVIVCLERIEDSIPATIEVEDRHIHYKHWIVSLAASPEDSVPFPLKSW
jgi:hypothetical protein